MPLTNKHILILSPQGWGGARISKHHYAEEMARRGNRVTFAAPVASGMPIGGFELLPVPDVPGLEVLNYRLPFPSIIKFKVPSLFHLLMRWQAVRILRKLGKRRVDLVWDFVSSQLFADLRAFSADAYVFHPVDMVQSGETRGADVVISLTDAILRKFEGCGVPTYFVNHGLGGAFAAYATEALSKPAALAPSNEHPLSVGYAGNLLLPYIDHARFRDVIDEHPDIEFHFWGPHTSADNNLGAGSAAGSAFVEYLRQETNVTLHGAVPQAQLVHALAGMSALIICYDATPDPNGAANSHKILEYLSTGRPVISTHISSYEAYPGLLEMLPCQDNSGFPAHFAASLQKLCSLDSAVLRRQRIEFALKHTYPRQLDRVEEILRAEHLLD